MAQTKKKVPRHKVLQRRGMKPVQVWFTESQRERLLQAAAYVGRSLTQFVHHQALVRAEDVILISNQERKLPLSISEE